MDHARNSIWEAARRTVLEIRFDTEGRPLNRAVRTVSNIKPARRHHSRRAAEVVRQLRLEAEGQIRTLKILGVASLLITAAIAILALTSASGAAPTIQQGFAVIHQFVGGFLS